MAVPEGFTKREKDDDLPAGFVRRGPSGRVSVGDVPEFFKDRPQPQAVQGLVSRGARKDLVSTFPQALGGVAEAGLTLATGTVGSIAGGVAGGIATALVNAGKGLGFKGLDKGAVASGVDVLERVSGAITNEPESRAGIDALSMISAPFEKFGELTTRAGEKAMDVPVIGGPELATAVKTGLEFAPALLGKRPSGGRTMADRRADVARVTKETGDLGLDVGAPIGKQREQIIDAAKREAGQSRSAQGFGDVQAALQDARIIQDKMVDSLYKRAKELPPASIGPSQVDELIRAIDDSLADRFIDKETTPKTVASLDRLSDITKGKAGPSTTITTTRGFSGKIQRAQTIHAPTPAARATEIKKLMEFRVGNNAVRGSNIADNAALSIINTQLDAYLRVQVAKDLIAGEPAVVSAWEKAFAGSKEFARTFDDDEVIKTLTSDLKATPEEAKRLIFNRDAVTGKTQAGQLVKEIGEILGKDHPAFNTFRQEVLFDIIEPLLKEKPNYNAFIDRYDKFVRKNDTLARELFPDSAESMQIMRDFAAAVEANRAAGFDMNFSETASRLLFGHEIAKAQVKVSVGAKFINLARSAVGTSRKRSMINALTKYDTQAPLLSKRVPAIGGLIQAGQQQEEINGVQF